MSNGASDISRGNDLSSAAKLDSHKCSLTNLRSPSLVESKPLSRSSEQLRLHQQSQPFYSNSFPTSHATMECERWLCARLDNLRMKHVLDQKTDGNLPQKLERSYAKFNPNERNIRGETLIISVIRYEPDKATQIRQMNTLIRSGCDVSLPDSKQLRTPLMVACLMRNDAIAHHLINNNANLLVADKKGNTALMYAAVYSRSSLLSHLCEQLVKRWALEAFLAKNCMGYTAEGLARKNERYMYSMMLKKQRLRIVKLLRDFVTSNLKYAPEFKSWQQFVSVYKVKRKFLSFLKKQSTYRPLIQCSIITPTISSATSSTLSKHTLPHLEKSSSQRETTQIQSNGKDEVKSQSASVINFYTKNLPRLPITIRRRRKVVNENAIASTIADGISSVCPDLSSTPV